MESERDKISEERRQVTIFGIIVSSKMKRKKLRRLFLESNRLKMLLRRLRRKEFRTIFYSLRRSKSIYSVLFTIRMIEEERKALEVQTNRLNKKIEKESQVREERKRLEEEK